MIHTPRRCIDALPTALVYLTVATLLGLVVFVLNSLV
jgi:hypothetical protein